MGSSVSGLPKERLMNGLLKVESGPGGLLVVSAKSLHRVLGVKRDFSNWIKGRIQQYGFECGSDYWEPDDSGSPKPANQTAGCAEYSTKRGNKTRAEAEYSPERANNLTDSTARRGGDRRSQDYWLSMDMAKELAMLERNEAGRAARKYFIQCERELVQAREDVAKLQTGGDAGQQAQKVEHQQESGAAGAAGGGQSKAGGLNGLSEAEVQSIRFCQAEWQRHPEVMKGLNSDIEYVVLPFVLLEFLYDMQDKGCIDLRQALEAVDLHEYGMELVEAVRMGRELVREEDLAYRKTRKAMSPELIGKLESSLFMMFKGVRAGRKAARVSRQLKGFGLMGPLG